MVLVLCNICKANHAKTIAVPFIQSIMLCLTHTCETKFRLFDAKLASNKTWVCVKNRQSSYMHERRHAA